MKNAPHSNAAPVVKTSRKALWVLVGLVVLCGAWLGVRKNGGPSAKGGAPKAAPYNATCCTGGLKPASAPSGASPAEK